MKNNNLLKILIPIVAVIVIFESIMVVSNLSKGKSTQTVETVTPVTSVPSGVVVQKTPIDLVFATDNKEMKIGSVYTVELSMISKIDYALDAIDLYIKYDKSAFDVSNLVFGSKLPKPTFSKISTLKSLLVANFLISDQTGLKIISNEVTSVMKFDIKPKKIGPFDFEINYGDENKESATLFVQNATSEVLPFSSNKLTVNVTR